MQDFLPVFLSIIILLIVTILEKQSKNFTSVAATMPVTITFALLIAYSAYKGEEIVVRSFAQNLLFNLFLTAMFGFAVSLPARSGLRIILILDKEYTVWK